jgi:hypothetical protein
MKETDFAELLELDASADPIPSHRRGPQALDASAGEGHRSSSAVTQPGLDPVLVGGGRGGAWQPVSVLVVCCGGGQARPSPYRREG